MPSARREIGFLVHDVARLLKTLADQEARHFGMTRAQWAVLKRLERHQGLKQSELAEMLDLQPITLTRLVDRLADNGLIERRADPDDRRVKRLYLTPAAKPLTDRLDDVAEDLLADACAGLDREATAQLLRGLETMKDNLRRALQSRHDANPQSDARRTSHG